MADQYSFDIVSQVDLQEIDNAIQQAKKELSQRFDFKGSVWEISVEQKTNKLTLQAQDDMKLKGMQDVLATKLAKRGVPLKALNYGVLETAFGGSVRQQADIVTGISKEKAKEVVQRIKEMKLKVQAAIQGEQIRVTSKSRDDLQTVIRHLKEIPIDIPLQFTNYR